MPLGNPITIENESRIISVTTTSTNDTFTVEGGYKINHINVYRNGVRLVSGNDFLANDATTVQLINSPNIGDVIEFHLFDEFLVNDAIVGSATSQTIYGDLVVNGNLYYNNSLVISNADYADVAGIATVATYASTAGIATNATNATTATYASTAGIATVAQNLTGSPDITVTGLTVEDSTAPNVEFKVTSTQATNTNKALTINNNDQTEGLDISYKGEILPKSNGEVNLGGPSNRWGNIYTTDINASGNVSIAGTITYQDVTDVDSVGVITARSGIRVGAGQSISPESGSITYYGDGSALTLNTQDLTIRSWLFIG